MLYCKRSRARTRLTLDGYQRDALGTDQNRKAGPRGLRIPLLGLFGEVGSLLSLPKRMQREKPTYANYEQSVLEELGDVLWYLSNLASRHGVHLSALALAKKVSEELRVTKKGNPALTFGQVARRLNARKARDVRVVEADYFALGGAVGRLMSEFAAGKHWDLDEGEFLRHLARSFHLLVRASNSEEISLNLAAHNNLAKIDSRWPKKRKFSKLFDIKRHENEQLPRRIVMYFEERKTKGKVYVFQSCRGINIGDRLTDNKLEQDDYRFHDVFHLAYAAILGWSPVMRALFRVKRKSTPSIDENEDGARPILIEEGIATWIFNHGLENKDFRYTNRLDYPLLKAIRTFVSGYEVEDCPLWEWELAILEGFKVFRMLKKYRRGWVIADLHRRSIEYRATRPPSQ